MQKTFKRILSEKQAEKLKGKYLDATYVAHAITDDMDGHDSQGNLLFRFRKNAIPVDLLKLGYESFEKSIISTQSRGNASGGYFNRVRKDGTVGNFKVSNPVESGNVGYMDAKDGVGTTNYCRKTSFASTYFEEFKQGIPFVQHVSDMYKELCPNHWKRQHEYVKATNKNYVIEGTVFTTVTVNKNFRTALHQDSGDLTDGFGNLCCYEDGSYTGGFFLLPEWGIGIEIRCGDMLFVDVHRWHCNTDYILKDGFDHMLRISFVMYYREYMYRCPSPSKVLEDLKNNSLGYKTL